MATLAYGLPRESRIRTIQCGLRVNFDTFLLAKAVDYLAFLCWAQTEDAAKGKNRPESISEHLIIKEESHGQFASADDFEAFRASLTREGDT